MIDSFAFCAAAGAAGGPGYAYKLPFNAYVPYRTSILKDLIFNGLAKGYVFGNGSTIISYVATKDNDPVSKRAYDFIKSLFDEKEAAELLPIN